MQVGEAVQSAAAILRENITLRQALLLTARGHVSTYVHNPVTPGAGSIGAAVSLSCATSADWVISPPPPVKELGKHLAMQVCMQPLLSAFPFVLDTLNGSCRKSLNSSPQ
jgi:translation elongation factor EF-Ts